MVYHYFSEKNGYNFSLDFKIRMEAQTLENMFGAYSLEVEGGLISDEEEELLPFPRSYNTKFKVWHSFEKMLFLMSLKNFSQFHNIFSKKSLQMCLNIWLKDISPWTEDVPRLRHFLLQLFSLILIPPYFFVKNIRCDISCCDKSPFFFKIVNLVPKSLSHNEYR